MKIKVKKSLMLLIGTVASTTIVASIAAACANNSKYELKPTSQNVLVKENDKSFINLETNLDEKTLKDLVFSVLLNGSEKTATKAVDIQNKNQSLIFKLEVSGLDKTKDNLIVISDNKKLFNTTTIKVGSNSSNDSKPNEETKTENSTGKESENTNESNGNQTSEDKPSETENQQPPTEDNQGETTPPSQPENPENNQQPPAEGNQGETTPPSQPENPENNQQPPVDGSQGENQPDNTNTPTPERQKLTISLESDEGYLKEKNSGNPTPDKKSPRITWNAVEGAQGYAVMMIDYEASIVTQSMPFIHWGVVNIKTNELPSTPIGQKIPNTISASSFIPGNDHTSQGQAIFYYPATPPNGIHNYEIKVFALSKEIDAATVVEVNNQVTYNKIEKAIFDAGVIDYDVKYILGRQINHQNGQLLPKEDVTVNRLFKDDQKTFIDGIDITNLDDYKVTLAQNQDFTLSTNDVQLTFNDTNENAKSYLVILSSTNSTQNQNTDVGTIHYAAIMSKDKTKKHLFTNSYGNNFYLDKYQHITKDNVRLITRIAGNKAAILENEQTQHVGVYTITVFGIDEEYDTLLANVNNVKNKYDRMFASAPGQSQDQGDRNNTITNAFEAMRNKVVSYGSKYKN